jgi:sigma-B regulation protein RsbU (phosphoserine phosphatase)
METVAATHPGEAAILLETARDRRRIAISTLPFTIGRSDACHATVADWRVSRTHATITCESGEYFITDAGSRHGTFVNGVRHDRQKLKSNDEITLGVPGARITFLGGAPVERAANVLLTRVISGSDTSELGKLRLFLEAARSLSSGFVVSDVLRNMLDCALRLTGAERGFVYLRDQRRHVLACGLDSKGLRLTSDAGVTQSVVAEAMATAAEFVTGDASQLSALAGRESIMLNSLRTIIALPLRSRRVVAGGQAEADGVLYLDSQAVSRDLPGVSHDVLRALASECASVLESARLVEAERAAQQYAQEMEIAASIQRSLISEPEVRCNFARVRGHTEPCKEVGGDFFDVHVSADAVTVIVADVSGKGIPAALLASVIHGMFYAQISAGTPLADCITAIHKFLCSRVAGQKYATLMAAQLKQGRDLQIVNCGHVPALLTKDGATIQVSRGDLPVGLIPDADFHAIEESFPVGSRFCIFTDGITESENAEGTEFGIEGVEKHVHGPDPVRQIFSAVEAFCGNREAEDDRTLVILERTM